MRGQRQYTPACAPRPGMDMPPRSTCGASAPTGCYAAASPGNSQPGKTSTPGWHLNARARTLARSTPRRTRSFSMAEMVACGMPVSRANWFWLSSWNSRTIRTDSPTETAIRFFAGRYSFTLRPPIIMGRHRRNLKHQFLRDHTMDHPPLQPEPRRAVARPCPGQRFIMESSDHTKARRPREGGDVFPFLVALQDFLGGIGKPSVDSPMLVDPPHAIS